jgi:hypothetical protein
MKWNAQFLSSKQVIFPYLLLLYRDNFLKVASLLWKTLSWTIYKIVKNSAQQVSIYCHNFIPNSQLSLCIVCCCSLYTRSFKHLHRKKSGTVRSGDRTGHGIPDTWKLFSSLVNTLHTSPIHCHWTGFEITWHNFFLGVQTLSPTPHRGGKSAFWNASLGSATILCYLTQTSLCYQFLFEAPQWQIFWVCYQ